MTVDRRHLLAGGAATIAATALLTSTARVARAATPPAGGQAPGFYRFAVGSIEITMINDGKFQRPLEAGFVRNAELPDVQAALADAFQPTDTLTIPITTTVINTGDRLVLIDAGTGGLLAPSAANWMANFRAAGYLPEQVDAVIVSHFHGDHIQGLRAEDGQPVFPNASLHVSEAEWAFWMDEAEMSRAPEAMQGAFKGVRRVFEPVAGDVQQYAGEVELVPGIRALPAPGHTPGHTAFLVSSGADSLLVWSDTTNKPELFVRNPDWHAVFDMDGEQAATTRKTFLEMAASDRLRVAGYHFPFPATGYIARENGGFRFVPALWDPA
jgi:glyoxylase-like metal-dependent hydrolase (beta-lactamase superfamily II)